MAATAPYPHVTIGVKDNSIYTPKVTEQLPLHMPLYMMKAQKGPIGIPVWCPTYTDAALTFGADTFNKRSKYFSEQSYFLLQTFPSNGAFIMRVAESAAKCAEISIELGLSKDTVGKVQQFKRDDSGRFVYELDGSKIPINSEGEECVPAEGSEVPVYSRALETVSIAGRVYLLRNYNYNYSPVVPATRRFANTEYFKGAGRPVFAAVTEETPAAGEFYFEYDSDGNTATPKYGITAFESGKDYVKLSGWETNFVEIPVSELPELAPGQSIGDKFPSISDAAITTVTESGVIYGAATSATAYQTYVFTRALDASNPYEYVNAGIPTTGGVSLTDRTYYYQSGTASTGELEDEVFLQGHKLVWRARVRSALEKQNGWVPGYAATIDTTNFKFYPMLDIVAVSPGAWGQKFGLKLYFNPTKNTVSGTLSNSAVTYTVAPVQLVADDVVPTPIADAYSQTEVLGVVRPGVVDPDSDTDMTLQKVVPAHYFDKYELPVEFTWVPSNWKTVGQILMNDEIALRSQIADLYPHVFANRKIEDATGDEKFETFVDALFGKVATSEDITTEDAGFMANPCSVIDSENIPYFCSCVVGADDPDVAADNGIVAGTVVAPTAATPIYLGGGDDGDISDAGIESYIRAQITAAVNQTQVWLVDYPRAPFNSIIDTGVSMATKKSYLDFMSVRDNLVVNLSTQTTWKKADGSLPTDKDGNFPNSQFNDESLGSSLRSYAWLMKEDVENGTEACRAKIFLHAGYRSDHEGPIPATLWIALKNAQYLNRDYIAAEPIELPNAAVECFSDISWTAGTNDTKSRCWNAGLNYIQCYGMNKKWHYAAVRSVYKYETSILVDGSTVDALTFMKDIIRREWANWSNSKRPVNELNALIKEALDSKFAHMLHGKYQYETKVFETDEDTKLGYSLHVRAKLIAEGGKRVWQTLIECNRAGFEPEE